MIITAVFLNALWPDCGLMGLWEAGKGGLKDQAGLLSPSVGWSWEGRMAAAREAWDNCSWPTRLWPIEDWLLGLGPGS